MLALGTGVGSPSWESSLLILKRLWWVGLDAGAGLNSVALGVVGGDGGRIVPDELGREADDDEEVPLIVTAE